MPRGDKSSYTDKQKRKAEHIEEGYKERGVSEDEAERQGLGHRQQGNRRRQEKRLRPWQDRKPQRLPQGRQDRRSSLRAPARRSTQGVSQEGGQDGSKDAASEGKLIRRCRSAPAHR